MIDLADLGLTKDELRDRVIDAICDRILTTGYSDEDGHTVFHDSSFKKTLDKRVTEHIDESIRQIADKHILPNVSSYIENLCLQETTKWGEKKGEPLTFVEYLVARADHYMREEVDYNGKTKAEAGGYSWSKSQTRITHLIHAHLHYSISTAMKSALQNATSSIAKGLEEAVRIKIAEIQKSLKVEVKA